jgi:hypothetical protein
MSIDKIESLADVRPGDLCLTTMGGFIPGVFPVRIGTALCKESFRIGPFSADHALICVEAGDPRPEARMISDAFDRRRHPFKWVNRSTGTDRLQAAVDNYDDTRLSLPAEAICSVLVDQAWSLAGKRVMEGVKRQCVTPGALAMRLSRTLKPFGPGFL